MEQPKQNQSLEELLQKIYENTEKTRKYILWGRVMSFIYLVLIIVPLILAIIYLPPLIENIVEPYKELLGGDPKAERLLEQLDKLQNNGLDLNQLLK